MANTATNHTDKNMVEQVVNRVQLEKVFKEEHSAKPACQGGDKVSKAYAANFGNSGTQRLRFGKHYWDTGSWDAFIRMLAPFLIKNKHWWHLNTEGEEVELVLHCAADDPTWAEPQQMHFRAQSMKDVQSLLDSSYEELLNDTSRLSQNECDVLFGERADGTPGQQASDEEGSDDDDDGSSSSSAGSLLGDEDNSSESSGADSEGESEPEYEVLQEWKVEEESYTGDLDEANSYAHGYGVLSRRLQEISTGQEKIARYSGKFKEGLPFGHGEEACAATGELWRGAWCQGLQDGLGEWHYTGGSVFRGTFKGGKPEGAGIYLPADSNKELRGTFTCEDGALRRDRAGEATWPEEFQKHLDQAINKAHEAAERAQIAAEAAVQAAQLRERCETRLAEEGFSQGPADRKEVREMRLALAVGSSAEHATTLLATYNAALAGDDAEELREAENRALFAVALAHGSAQSLIKEHELQTSGDYSKISKILQTAEAVEIAYKGFFMQIRVFDLRGLDVRKCAVLAAESVEHYRNQLLADGMPNATRIGRIMQSVHVKTCNAVRVDARRHENVAQRATNAQGRARDELRDAYARLSVAQKLKQKKEELNKIKRQQSALSKQHAAVAREIEELKAESGAGEGAGEASEQN